MSTYLFFCYRATETFLRYLDKDYHPHDHLNDPLDQLYSENMIHIIYIELTDCLDELLCHPSE